MLFSALYLFFPHQSWSWPSVRGLPPMFGDPWLFHSLKSETPLGKSVYVLRRGLHCRGWRGGDQRAVRNPGVSVNQSTFALLPVWSEGDGRNCQCLDFHLISLVSIWPGPAPHCAWCPQGKGFSSSVSSDKPRVFYQNDTEVAIWLCRPIRRPEHLSALYIQTVNQPPPSAPPLTRPCTGTGSFPPLNLPTALLAGLLVWPLLYRHLFFSFLHLLGELPHVHLLPKFYWCLLLAVVFHDGSICPCGSLQFLSLSAHLGVLRGTGYKHDWPCFTRCFYTAILILQCFPLVHTSLVVRRFRTTSGSHYSRRHTLQKM